MRRTITMVALLALAPALLPRTAWSTTDVARAEALDSSYQQALFELQDPATPAADREHARSVLQSQRAESLALAASIDHSERILRAKHVAIAAGVTVGLIAGLVLVATNPAFAVGVATIGADPVIDEELVIGSAGVVSMGSLAALSGVATYALGLPTDAQKLAAQLRSDVAAADAALAAEPGGSAVARSAGTSPAPAAHPAASGGPNAGFHH